jgi:hypothetical protein
MPLTDHRRVRVDYWYTTLQISEIGQAWTQQGPNRVFLHCDQPNRTAFNAENVPHPEEMPQKILLSLNKGSNHWTAIAVDISAGEDGMINVQISLTDSLNTDLNLRKHSSAIRWEMARIESLFREIYGARLNINSGVYPYTWQQPDKCSCGPFSMANGARCLAGAGEEPNPGRKIIREQQLNMMSSSVAFRGCSTSNAIDEILLDWILDRVQNGESILITTPEDVAEICSSYAEKYQRTPEEIARIFHQEYTNNATIPWFRPAEVNMRVREIMSGLRLEQHFVHRKNENAQPPSQPSTSTKPMTKQPSLGRFRDDHSNLSLEELERIFQRDTSVLKAAEGMGHENICKKIDDVRKLLTTTMGDEAMVMDIMEHLTMSMYKANLHEAEEILNKTLSRKEHGHQRQTCLMLISDIIGMRKYHKDNDEKFIYLASSYSSISEAMQQIKHSELASLKAPKKALEAYSLLLQGAIERNKTNILRQVCFAISDFCSSLLESISSGLWKSDIKRIETISNQFKDSEGNISVDQLECEHMAIATLMNARTSLQKEISQEVKHQRWQPPTA